MALLEGQVLPAQGRQRAHRQAILSVLAVLAGLVLAILMVWPILTSARARLPRRPPPVPPLPATGPASRRTSPAGREGGPGPPPPPARTTTWSARRRAPGGGRRPGRCVRLGGEAYPQLALGRRVEGAGEVVHHQRSGRRTNIRAKRGAPPLERRPGGARWGRQPGGEGLRLPPARPGAGPGEVRQLRVEAQEEVVLQGLAEQAGGLGV